MSDEIAFRSEFPNSLSRTVLMAEDPMISMLAKGLHPYALRVGCKLLFAIEGGVVFSHGILHELSANWRRLGVCHGKVWVGSQNKLVRSVLCGHEYA